MELYGPPDEKTWKAEKIEEIVNMYKRSPIEVTDRMEKTLREALDALDCNSIRKRLKNGVGPKNRDIKDPTVKINHG